MQLREGLGRDLNLLTKKLSPPRPPPLPFPSYLTSFLLWLETKYWKKVSLIAFKQILPKILPMLHIFNFIIMAYLKNFIGIESLSTKQSPAELSPWIIHPILSILAKVSPLLSSWLLPPPCMDCPTPSPKHIIWGKPCRWGRGGEPHPAAKTCLFPTSEESPSPNSLMYRLSC